MFLLGVAATYRIQIQEYIKKIANYKSFMSTKHITCILLSIATGRYTYY